MNMTKIYQLLSNRLAVLALIVCTLGLVGCTENEDELAADHKGRMNVVPYAKGRAAVEKWNAREEVNG